MNSNHNKARTRKWWYRGIRSGSWFSFRYYWFAWLCFLLGSVLLLYFLYTQYQNKKVNHCADLSLKTIHSINDALDNCCNCQNEDTNNSHVFSADYLVITYQFDQNGGKDLDTKTEITTPTHIGPLGWGQGNNDMGAGLTWSGDNTGYGVESCFVDLTKFGTKDLVTIQCAAFWFSRRASGEMSLDVRAYEGGTMKLMHPFQFVNEGGNETAFVSFNGNVRAEGKNKNLAESIGYITYDKKTKRLTFNPAQ